MTNRELIKIIQLLDPEGTPIIPVKDEWTSEEIVRELDKIRANYIEVKLKENGLSKIAAAL